MTIKLYPLLETIVWVYWSLNMYKKLAIKMASYIQYWTACKMSRADGLELQSLNEGICSKSILQMHLVISDTEPSWTNIQLLTYSSKPPFLLWSTKEGRLLISVCKHYELANQKICGGELLPQINMRLQKEASDMRAQLRNY